MRVGLLAIVACGCGAPTAPTPAAPVAVAVAADAAVATPIDAAAIPDEVANAPAWVFRYNAAGRLESWTLRFHGDVATMDVVTATGPTHYVGTAADGPSLVLTLSAGPARLSLDCKRNKLAVGRTCGEAKPAKLDVLDCFHPDFKEPMPFGPAPGIEYVDNDRCRGYRTIAE
jgi:hypothetical protein